MTTWRAVSFDCDQTLSSMDPPNYVTIATILERHGVHVDPDAVHHLLTTKGAIYFNDPLRAGRGWAQLTAVEQNAVFLRGNRHLLQDLDVTGNLDALAQAINQEWYGTRRLYPDVLATFQQLASMGLTLAILAGPSSTAVQQVLDQGGLTKYIACYATTDIVSPRYGPLQKVDRISYKYLVDQLLIRPSELLHVGDHVHLDYEIPRGLGITAILINRTDRADLHAARDRGYRVIRNFQQLVHFITQD